MTSTEGQPLRFDRRGLLQGFAAALIPPVVVGLTAEPVRASPSYSRVIPPAIEQWNSWRVSSLSNDEFKKRYEQEIKKIRIGTSFSPEQYVYLARQENSEAKINQSEVMDALEIILGDWGVRDVRLGLRRNQILEPDGSINLLKYHPYIQKCLDHGVKITLNIGPDKVFHDPESHNALQDFFVPGLMPPIGSVITLDSRYGQHNLEQANKVLSTLKDTYPGADFDLQPDNEPKNNYGQRKYTFDDPYLIAIIEIMNNHYPKSNILLNSMGGLNTPDISGIFKELITKNPQFKGRLISGVDFYYTIADYYSALLKRKIDSSLIPGVGQLDMVSVSNILHGEDVFWQDDINAFKIGYLRKTAENQIDSWGKNRNPGKSVRDYRFTLARNIDSILFISNLPDDISREVADWGDVALVRDQMNNKLTAGQAEIIQLKKYINSQKMIA